MSGAFFPQSRVARLCRRAVSAMAIDLRGIRVLTEAATGPFAATAALAAFAGADVVAVSRDSRWGRAEEAFEETRAVAAALGCERAVVFSARPVSEAAAGCDLVTNLGFVRPIDAELVSRLSNSAAISLMWEPWEFREGDIDRAALDGAGVPLIATNETHPEVRTFAYLGPTIGRLLLNEGVEIVGSRIVLVGSDPFGAAVAQWLAAAGAVVARSGLTEWGGRVCTAQDIDALVVVEHRDHRDLLKVPGASEALFHLAALGAPIVRLCGVLDRGAVEAAGGRVAPSGDAPAGVMSVTTAHAGPRPVIDLHAAGLKAGGLVVRARREGATVREAVAAAVASRFGVAMEGAS